MPYVILKWAESADGFMAPSDRKPRWISNEYSRQRVHQWRSEEDAVLVGTGTAVIDNPHLNVRDWTGRNPVRVVIDPSLRLPQDLHVFDRSQQTICFNRVRNERSENLELVQIGSDKFLPDLLAALLQRNIGSVIVEGGAHTLGEFIKQELWHEARVFRSDQSLHEGVPSPRFDGKPRLTDRATGDALLIYENARPS